ncbi:MAG: hypothetical protein ABSG13_18485 [Bryobacteraceae bacterium]
MNNITGRKTLAQTLKQKGFPITDSTIYRWEKSNQIPNYPPMKRLKHNGQLVYTEEHIAAIIAYMTEEETTDFSVAHSKSPAKRKASAIAETAEVA